MTFVKVNNNGLKPFTNLVDEFMNEFPSFGRALNTESFGFPPVNIHETKDAYHLELNVPGRSKEDFQVSMDNGLLTIGYEKKEETKSDDYKTVRREFSFKSFKRSFTIDQQIDTGAIQAKYENGLLKLLLPKKAEATETIRQITVG